MRHLLRNRRFWLVAAVIIALMAGMNYTSKNPDAFETIERTIIFAFNPVQRFFSGLGYTVREGVSSVPAFIKTREENEVLKKQVAELGSFRHKFIESIQENIKLRNMLGFRDRNFQYDLEAAQVIGREPDNWFDVVIIDKGEGSGVLTDMAVITDEGLVGKILSAGKDYAKVLLITDDRSSVGATIQRTRDSGLLKGTIPPAPRGHAKMVYLPQEANLVKGDVVITSGNGVFIPKGIVIGEIADFDKSAYDLMQSAIIKPRADLQKLELVFVVKEQRGVAP